MILNNKAEEISEETKQRVLSVIKENNYTPNSIARSLVTNRTNIIGLVVPDITNPYFPELIRSIENKANCLGYNVLLCNSDDDQNKENEYISILRDKRVDGIIFISTVLSDHNAVAELSCGGMPVVVLDRVLESENLKAIYVDNVEGGYIATRYLIENGHRRIGCITGPLKNKSAGDRYDGYCKALYEAGIEINSSFIYEGDYKISSGEKGITTLIESGITAVFAGNDLMAFGAYKTIYELGLKIPQDISVIGYDDIFLSNVLTPPLSTVRQPRVEMGGNAVDTLIKMIKDRKSEDNTTRYSPKLIERKSVRSLL